MRGKYLCSGCGRWFSGGTTFDAHRAGDFETDDRYCLTPEQAGLSPVQRTRPDGGPIFGRPRSDIEGLT